MKKNVDSLLFYLILLGIIIFSFAPWLTLISKFSYLLLDTFYLIYFLIYICISGYNLFVRNWKKAFLAISLLILCVFSVFINNNNAVLLDFKNMIIPLIFLLLLNFKHTIKFSNNKRKIINFVFITCILANIFYGFFQVFTFNGDFSKLYVYGEHFKEYNYYRNGRLRAFGFLSSPTMFSNYLVICLIYVLSLIKNKKNILIYIFSLLIILAIYFSGSRTPLLILFVVSMSYILLKKIRLYFPIFSILFYFFFLLMIYIFRNFLDLSVIGRFEQFKSFCSLLIDNPFGYGIGFASYPLGVISFDSGIYSMIINLGLFYFLIVFYGYNRLNKKFTLKKQHLSAILLSMFFLSSFFVNTIHLGINFIFIFTLILTEVNHENTISSCTL